MSDEQKTNKKIIVCYSVDYDNEYSVEINIENYEEQTLTHLSTLLASIPSVQFQVQTMNIVKDAFLQDGKGEELELLVSQILLKSESLLTKMQQAEELKEEDQKGSNEPCIKPSDIL